MYRGETKLIVIGVSTVESIVLISVIGTYPQPVQLFPCSAYPRISVERAFETRRVPTKLFLVRPNTPPNYQRISWLYFIVFCYVRFYKSLQTLEMAISPTVESRMELISTAQQLSPLKVQVHRGVEAGLPSIHQAHASGKPVFGRCKSP